MIQPGTSREMQRSQTLMNSGSSVLRASASSRRLSASGRTGARPSAGSTTGDVCRVGRMVVPESNQNWL
jgi:hypothetical protein